MRACFLRNLATWIASHCSLPRSLYVCLSQIVIRDLVLTVMAAGLIEVKILIGPQLGLDRILSESKC